MKSDKLATAGLPKTAMMAEVVRNSVDKANRTVDVVWSTGQRVRFYDWEIGEYDLTLGLKPENVDLAFAKRGAPVLDSHSNWSVSSVLGAVDDIRVDGSTGTATLRFSSRPEVDPIFQDVQDGILRFVSVGTRLRLLRDITQEEDKVPHYFAELHEPLEISLAPIPKDRGAVVQGENGGERFPVELVAKASHSKVEKEDLVEDPDQNAAGSAVGTVVNQADGASNATNVAPITQTRVEQKESALEEEVIKQAQEAERTRGIEIRKLVKQARLDDAFADEMIVQNVSVDAASRKILDKLATQSDALDIRSTVSVTRDETETIRQSVASALLHRMRPGDFKLEQRANEFVGMSLLEINRDLLSRHGISTRGLTRMEIARQSLHATSDFPEILANVAGKTLRRAYDATPRSFMPWAREATLPDFKQVSRIQIGESPALQLVRENGEFTRGTVGEGAEKYQLATYGRVVGLSRQAIVNDDMSAFTRIVEGFAVQAANLQSDIVYGIITGNPNMADGIALFNASHNNVSGGASVISISSLGAMRSTMRRQRGLDGTTFINVDPRFLLVPAALETVAQQFLAQVQVDTQANFNPFAGSMQAIVEPRLDTASASVWYGVASPAQIDTIEYGYLEGQSGPFLESRQGFDVDGVEFKARLDFAAKAIDWRGFYRNSA